MKEYSKGIYVKFKPEEVEILHDRRHLKQLFIYIRNEYRQVKKDDYLLVDDLHEALVSEEVWEQAQVKVAAQAKKIRSCQILIRLIMRISIISEEKQI